MIVRKKNSTILFYLGKCYKFICTCAKVKCIGVLWLTLYKIAFCCPTELKFEIKHYSKQYIILIFIC